MILFPSDQEELVVFEAFEASPLSANVLASENALLWDFPGEAVAVPLSTFSDASFQESLAAFLEQSSTECIKRFGAKTEKSGFSTFEPRDTADPSMVTGMLMTLLEANGHRCCPKLLRKRIHDDVCWAEGGEKPWRRSAFWLVLRVGIERYLRESYGGEEGRAYYKFLLCIMISQLLRDALNTLDPELLMCLKTKLCRRVAKLQVDRDRSSWNVRPLYDTMFSAFGNTFRTAISNVNDHVDGLWSELKRQTQRQIGYLPLRANYRDLTLSLPNSERYLTEVLQCYQSTNNEVARARRTPNPTRDSVPTANKVTSFAERYYRLSDIETGIETTYPVCAKVSADPEASCLNFAGRLESYLDAVADAYDSNPEQKSLELFCAVRSWVLMDRYATQAFDLLKEYNPGIPPDSLDVLHLSHYTDLVHLQEIQQYLEDRWLNCGRTNRTIFDDPTTGCFAERYFDNSKDSAKLQELERKINQIAEARREKKEEEWEETSARFEELEREISQSTCLSTTDRYGSVAHNDRECRKCYLQRRARRMQINIYEDPLPSKPVEAKAMIFELSCPEAFRAYRNATWKVIGTLGRSRPPTVMEPRLLLRDYSEAKQFIKKQKEGITLASVTKSFLSTHYRGIRFPVDLESVCYPNGLQLKYFDTLTQIWPGRQWQKPTFSHHCQLNIAEKSTLSSLFKRYLAGPSSYEIVANQTNCPPGLNLHEFTAYQTLLSGQSRRWISMLVELGSANLNFSTEMTATFMSHLSSQVGPADPSGDPLRVIHKVFRDTAFCNRLMEQIRRRLDGVSPNWRETTCMEMLLTLTLKLYLTGSEPVKVQAMNLLDKARDITLGWINQLRAEIHTSTKVATAERCSKYAFLAALLCRRTFAVYAENMDTEDVQFLPPTVLRSFIESSITMQDNMASDPASLDQASRTWLIRDLKMAHRMRSTLRKSLDAFPTSLEAAINTVWPQSGEHFQRSYSDPQFVGGPRPFWIRLSMRASEQSKEQVVLYHLLEGHLLVDGEPLGKLPADHRKAVVLEQLFGNQTLLTYPSYLPGMTYTLAFHMWGHQVHFGFRNGILIVQACYHDTILELVPRDVFGNPANFDLPAALIENCAHWLDLRNGILDIRPQSSYWKSKVGNWKVDFNTRKASRRMSALVDPNSRLFQRVARVFDRFEHPSRLTVFQPKNTSLSVELRRLELSFFVNYKKLLECRQLKSEIDPDQDAGTWYGLDSKLVIRDTFNYANRSVLVPMGQLTCTRNKFHVALGIGYSGNYGRFAINDVLGRLDCAAEPWLLFMKAQLHAYTSFVLPDRLTGRTGTEEAVHCLKSGYCQPWTPLNMGALQSLVSIAKLSPKRTYYPSGSKNMQHVLWNSQLTVTIQHDAFRPIVERILKKSADLSLFTHKTVETPELEQASEPILHRRAYWKRLRNQRPNSGFDVVEEPEDVVYASRDHFKSTASRQNVFEAVTIIRNWPSKLYASSDLAGILQSWPNIQGYDGQFNKVILSDLLDIDFAAEWGPLANFCLASGQDDMYRLMMMFALMSYRGKVDMLVIRTMIAFMVLEDVKSLAPPKWTSYTNFRSDQTPSQDCLKQLISQCSLPGTEYEGEGLFLSYKSRRQREAKERAHEQEVEEECTALAEFLLAQWPCQEPTLKGRPSLRHIDVGKVSAVVCPEWLRLFQNIQLSDYVNKVQLVLNRQVTRVSINLPQPACPEQEIFPTRCRGGETFELSQDLLRKPGPNSCFASFSIVSNRPEERGSTDSVTELANQLESMKISSQQDVICAEIRELTTILDDIANSQSTVQQQYAWDMVQSLTALKKVDAPSDHPQIVSSVGDISEKILRVRQEVHERFEQLNAAFDESNPLVEWLKCGGLWPCVTPVTLLEQLRSTSTAVFGSRMKECLFAYAVAITALQRLLRLRDAHFKGNNPALQEELKNTGHTNWKPDDHGDWLLLEIDTNMLIRPAQVDVALATISPSSGSNSVLQMNMGQGKFIPTQPIPVPSGARTDVRIIGKTSCIMPMAAAELADATSLLRLIVPKALLVQTAQLLQSRLGGLIGREISHVPFSRKTLTDSDTIKTYLRFHRDIMGSRGVILGLPEHIMSFKLSGLQRLSDSRVQEAKLMIKVQNWIQKVCRDILDECDFTLAARTQLIYPSGSQATVDGHPQRWETAEELLRLVENHLWNLQHDFPESIEVIERPGGRFPTVFFLRSDVEDALLARLVKDIIRGQTSILSLKECTPSDRFAIKSFISSADVQPSATQRVSQLFPDDLSARQNLYLLRGLLVHRILLLTLKKRWNVQYGLHPTRDPIAVPFHAKGVPSDQAEWGHPDVAILFTCLSFYFGGLELSQLRQSLQHLVKSDDPSSEYDRWTQSCTQLPGTLRDWNVINVDDEAQLTDIWQCMRYQVVVIDYFLNHFVFPRHAKQFQVKLQTSGWDIPLFSPGATSTARTTGFSGTNDNRTMLPLTIKQQDLPALLHTSAEVLTYLLQRRSRRYVHVADINGKHVSEIGFLQMLCDMKIRVLIDAGAMILEMDNLRLAEAWLKVDYEAPAVVYFDSENKPFVLYRHGTKVPLLASPFAENLGDCLVYLDEAHTRGTDLKMRSDAVGALTLGLGQTKDHTVQGKQIDVSQTFFRGL